MLAFYGDKGIIGYKEKLSTRSVRICCEFGHSSSDCYLCTIFEQTELTGKDRLVHDPLTRTNSIIVSDIQQSLFSPSK